MPRKLSRVKLSRGRYVYAVQPPDAEPPCDNVPAPPRPFVVVGGNLVIHD
jgi:hypothetical protein